MNCIEIANITVISEELSRLVSFKLKIEEKSYDLVFKIIGFDELDEDSFDKRIDSVVVMLFLHAMMHGYNIKSAYPISEQLYYQLIFHVMPQINKCNPFDATSIYIDAPCIDDSYKGSYVGTGLSGGVDSLATIYEYTDLCKMESYKITHLFYFKAGAHDGQLGYFNKETEDALYLGQLDRVRSFSEKLRYPLIEVETNFSEIINCIFGFSNYDQTHTIRNCGIVLLFQQFFNKYYYADAYSLDSFSMNITGDMAHYEKWLLPLLSNGSIWFYSANKAMGRLEKTELLTTYPFSYDNLLVCWLEKSNCGKCDKCIRTLVTLDLLGCLEKYKNSFNIEEYKKNRTMYISRVVAARKFDLHFNEIYHYMKNNHIKMPPKYRVIFELIKYITERLRGHSLKDIITYIRK